MATRFRMRRRAAGGASGAPSTALAGELNYNEQDGYIYVGFGDDGSGNATSIKVIAKDDFNVARRPPTGGSTNYVLAKNSGTDYDFSWAPLSGLAGAYAPLTSPAFTGTPTAPTPAAGNNTTAISTTAYVVTAIAAIPYAPLTGATFTGTVSIPTAAAGTNSTVAASTAFVNTALAPYATLASPTLTGVPAAPTPAAGTNSTAIATTAFVATAISNVINNAGPAYDTLKELGDLIINDEAGIASLVTSVGGKLTASSNLSDLVSVSAARTNLGLLSMATQAASAVAITGGTIDGVILDAGTF